MASSTRTFMRGDNVHKWRVQASVVKQHACVAAIVRVGHRMAKMANDVL